MVVRKPWFTCLEGIAITLLVIAVRVPLHAAEAAKPAESGSVVDVPGKVVRYLERRFRQLDKNQNGRLEPAEWQTPQSSSNSADANRDGILTRDELKDRFLSYGRLRRVRVLSSSDEGSATPTAAAAADSAEGEASDSARINGEGENSDQPKSANGGDVSKSQPRRDTQFFVPAPRLPQGLPEWWRARDTNGDGQLSLREFAPQASSADIAGFKKLDVNSDGLVTPTEYVRATSSKKPETVKSPETPTR